MIPVGIACSYPFLPETPRCLVYRGRFEEAEAAIKELYGPNYNAVEEVHLLRLQVEEQRELHKATSIVDCFKAQVYNEPSSPWASKSCNRPKAFPSSWEP